MSAIPLWPAALAQARLALHLSQPNPHVGCVITSPAGDVLGQGHTQQAGGPHAEVMALGDAQARGHDVRGATAWVTLEPCSHHGRTPPCADALVAAGLARVEVALADPNPRVAGQGVARLRAAGIAVNMLDPADPVARESFELNIGFMSRMVRGTPWVRLKIAASLDGRTSLANGISQWITGPGARADGHAWRARADAVLTGIGTALEDDPMLDVRLIDVPRQPHLVLVDSRLQARPEARLFGRPDRQVWIYTASDDEARAAPLRDRGATIVRLPNAHGKVDLPALLADMARREVGELHVEAGHKLNGSFVREGLVDELLAYLAPKLIGDGRGMADFGPLAELSQALPLQFRDIHTVGPDLRLVARVPGRDSFMSA
ncbi:MAG: bifunctional diaminohydroxyphosphoribosylaminopyrimidine deaminase/5-amino-6-(5-phosphoribosylamino)uracil reductase RibD [Burkholderiales bacterium]|nr:bifunctional diaminohydroxyphosphoribosylaminopyrimidine deaminase/5-amino-6-(5-phosphoribosylamino)uracil reductase RibD [Burkholderiales bacterium]